MNFAKLSWNEKRDLLETLPKQKAIYLAADWAKAVLSTFEERFPNDLRPRKAIEAVYNGLSPEDCRKAAHAANAAWAAAYAANAAAYAAHAAAQAAQAAYAANAAYSAANAAHAAAYAAHAAYANAAYASRISPDLVNEIWETSQITIPKHLYTHDIRLMLKKAWDGENTLPYIADALEDLGFDTKELRNKPFHGRSHGIFFTKSSRIFA